MRLLLRSFRFIFWFVQTYSQKHGRLIFLGFLSGFFIFLLISRISPLLFSIYTTGGPKRIAVIGSYIPSNLPLNLQNLISLGLTSLNVDGEATASIARKWEIRDEGKTYIFYLRNDLYWHDGTKFKSRDINYNLKDVKMEAVSDEIFKISLKEPFSPLPTVLAKPIFKAGLVGLGPYKVKRIKLKVDKLLSITLVGSGAAAPALEYKFYPNETSAITAYKLGEVDQLERISQVDNFTSWPNTSVSSRIFANYNTILFFNLRVPFLQKRTVRQALAYALPEFSEEKSLGPLNPNSWAYNPQIKIYSHDPELSKTLLEKEGLSTVSAELTLATFSSFLSYAQEIAAAWEKIGIKINVKIENSLPASFDVLLASQEIPADPDQYHLWHSTQSTNLTGFANLKIDKLLEDGRRISDKEKRLKIYQDFQKYLVEEAPAIFLYHPKLYRIERK